MKQIFCYLIYFQAQKNSYSTTLYYCKVRLGNITVYWVDNYSPILLWHCRSTCTRVWLKNTSIFAYILWKSTAMENRTQTKTIIRHCCLFYLYFNGFIVNFILNHRTLAAKTKLQGCNCLKYKCYTLVVFLNIKFMDSHILTRALWLQKIKSILN